jgi:hypothetical protein
METAWMAFGIGLPFFLAVGASVLLRLRRHHIQHTYHEQLMRSRAGLF